MISEHDHLVALAKVIRQCAATIDRCVKTPDYQRSRKEGGTTVCPLTVDVIEIRAVILALLTPAMIEAEKQNADTTK